MERIFENILDKDEKIISVIKPSKVKFYWAVFCSGILLFITFCLFPFLVLFSKGWPIMILLIPIFCFIVIIAGVVLLSSLRYKNLFYAYSNKRIIVRSGLFGIDYKSLDMSMIGAVDVNVSLLDKMVRKNTGSIFFGSMASPMGNGGGYTFSNIVAPYDLYKEIKSVIDTYKENKKNNSGETGR